MREDATDSEGVSDGGEQGVAAMEVRPLVVENVALRKARIVPPVRAANLALERLCG